MREAYKHWHSDVFTPRNSEHLRYWCEWQAGFYDPVVTTETAGANTDWLASWLVKHLSFSDDPKLFTVVDESDNIILCKVRTTNWSELGQDDFQNMSQAVYEVLAVHGLDHNQLLAEKGQEA
jgi:hypothetical protein